jgi:hypothetical protein
MQIVNQNDRDYANQIKGRLTAASTLGIGKLNPWRLAERKVRARASNEIALILE